VTDETLLAEAVSQLAQLPKGPWRCLPDRDTSGWQVYSGEGPTVRLLGYSFQPGRDVREWFARSRLYVEALVRMVEVRDRIMADWADDNAAVLGQGRRQGLALAALKAREWVSRTWPDRATSQAVHDLAGAIEVQADTPPLPADALRLENARLRKALRGIAEYEPRQAWAVLQRLAREALGETDHG
jgi:hypothetical protein